MINYRTRVYLAADWDNDKEVIDKLRYWNDSDYWKLNFSDAHDLTKSSDDSLNCSIKSSLSLRMNASKIFILIVGDKTDELRSRNCYLCKYFSIPSRICLKGHSISNKSFIDFECEKAIRDGMKIIVIYNYSSIQKSKCPEILRNKGEHIVAYYWIDNKCYWNYSEIKKAIMD